jgi:hypothetical protein
MWRCSAGVGFVVQMFEDFSYDFLEAWKESDFLLSMDVF